MTENKLKNKRARAVADLTQGTILATVEIAVAPERVFAALTRPEQVPRWWGAEGLYRTTEYSADLRVGGRWQGTGVMADGERFSLGGEFLEVDPPRLLVQTWQPDWDGGNVTTLTYRLEAIEGGTRLTLRHDGFSGRPDSCAGHSAGWERVLGWLTEYVSPSAARRYFYSKLIPPRPSFALDMTASEREVMQQHVGYWTKLLEEGRALLFGPVGDPKGAFGVGILVGDDEAELIAIEDADPAIRAGLGFQYELHPMLNVVTRL